MFYMHENAKFLIFKFANLLLFAAVKEFCKSTKNWQSYSHDYGGTLFL